MEAGAITASFELDISDFKRNIGIVQSETQSSTKKIRSFVGPAIKSFAALSSALGVSKIVSASRSAYKDYRKELNNVATVSNLTGKQLDKFGKRFLKLGGSMGKTSDLVSGAYQAFSAGAKNSAEAFDITAEAAKFARGQVTSISASVDILTTAMNAYGQETIDAGRASDVFATIIRQGKINGDQLSSSIGNSISIYAAAGVAIEELGAGIATMTSKGVSSAETMTKMNAIIRELQKPTDNMAKLMQKLGYESGQAMLNQRGLTGTIKILNEATGGNSEKLYQLFSSMEAVSGVTTLMSGDVQMLTDKLDAMNNSVGNSDAAFEKQLTGTEFMRDNWDKLLVVLGAKTEPIFTKVGRIVEAFTSSVTTGNWGELKKSITEVIPYISVLTASFVSIGVAIGSIKIGLLVNKIADAIKFFSTFGGKLGLVIGGITLLSVAVKKGIKMSNAAAVANGRYTDTQIEQAKQSKEVAKAMYIETLQKKKMLEHMHSLVSADVRAAGAAKRSTVENIRKNKVLDDLLESQGIETKTLIDLNELHGVLGNRLNIQNQNLVELNKTFGTTIDTQSRYIRGSTSNFEITNKLNTELERLSSSTDSFNEETEKSVNALDRVKRETGEFAKTLTDDLLKAAGAAGNGLLVAGGAAGKLTGKQNNAAEAALRLERSLDLQKIGLTEAEKKYVDAVAELGQMEQQYKLTGAVGEATGEAAVKIIEEQRNSIKDMKDAIKNAKDEASKGPDAGPFEKWGNDVKNIFEKTRASAIETGEGAFVGVIRGSAQAFKKINADLLKPLADGFKQVGGGIKSAIDMFGQNRLDEIELENREALDSINERYDGELEKINETNYEKQALEEYRKEEEQNLTIQQDEALFNARQEHNQKIREYENANDEEAIQKENARWAKQKADIIADYNFKKEDLKKRDMDAALRQKIKDKEKEIRDRKIKEQEESRRREIKEQEEKSKSEKNEQMKQAFEANKAFQIAEIAIAGPAAAMSAYSALAGIPLVGPVLGAAAAAAAIGFSIAQIVAVSQRQFIPQAAEGGQVVQPGLVQINEEGGEIRKLSNQELIIPAQLSQEIIAGAIDRQAPQGEIVFNNEFIINNADEDVESRIIEVMQEQISYAAV